MTISNSILNLGIKAKEASSLLSLVSENKKNLALKNLKHNLNLNRDELININKIDISNAKKNNLGATLIDRLTLSQKIIDGMISSIEEIIKIKDPVGKILQEWERPNGLIIQKISIPLGVVGIIYESRPNVTIDASMITMKSGNAVILRGGTDSFNTSTKLKDIIVKSFLDAELPENIVQMIDNPERISVDEMLKLNKYIDVIIPRGGKNLIKKVVEKSSIPIIKHLDGICHIYVGKNADLVKAKKIIFNSKMRRPGICGAAETLLIDKSLKNKIIYLIQPLLDVNCEVRVDKNILQLNPSFKLANDSDWGMEYLDKIISVKLVENIEDAINHINKFSSGHTECIVTEKKENFDLFFNQINSAIILQNASTQFADGGEFGFGAEIGISTDKLHVRGPVGVEHLTSFKYSVRGSGQVRK